MPVKGSRFTRPSVPPGFFVFDQAVILMSSREEAEVAMGKLFILFILIFLLSACPGPDPDNDPPEKEPVSVWNGYFMWKASPHQLGTISSWKLYKDGTSEGTWKAGDLFTLSAGGNYALNGTNYEFDFSGTATGVGIGSSGFDAFGSGTLTENHGTGTYTIEFDEPLWTDQLNETWEVIVGNTEFGSYIIETFPNGGAGDVDTLVNLYNSSGFLINSDDDSGTSNYSLIDHGFLTDRIYYIEVYSFGGSGYYSLLVNESGGGSSAGDPPQDEGEPDAVLEQAPTISLETVYDRYLTDADVDWFKINIP